MSSANDNNDAEDVGCFEEWTSEELTTSTSTSSDSTTSVKKESELSIQTALTLPLTAIYFSPEELASIGGNPFTTASSSSSLSSATSLPLLIASEKLRGIAFQLWPAAKVFADFMLTMQSDQNVAKPMEKKVYERKQKEEKGDVGETKEVDGDAAASGSTAAASAASSAASAASSSVASPVPSIPHWWSTQRVLELGAGCGLNGMLAAVLGAKKVTLTDMQSVIPHLQANIDANFGVINSAASVSSLTPTAALPPSPLTTAARQILHSRCHTAALEWSTSFSSSAEFTPDQFDVILLSDCVYWEDLFLPLVCTLRALSSPATRIFLCQTPRRPKIEKRFYKMMEKYFKMDLVRSVAALEETEEKKDVKLYEFKKKA